MTEPAWVFDADGCLAGVQKIASPNCDSRPQGASARIVVIHAISLPPGEFGGDAIERLFTNRLDRNAHPYFRQVAEVRVSSHFLVRRDGTLIQFVPATLRAWHAGNSCWRGNERCNDYSIGIELEGDDFHQFEHVQYQRLNELLSAMVRSFPIEAIVGHSDVAPGRKTDPGPCFEWRRLTVSLTV